MAVKGIATEHSTFAVSCAVPVNQVNESQERRLKHVELRSLPKRPKL